MFVIYGLDHAKGGKEMKEDSRLHVHISDVAVANKVRNFCKQNNMHACDFVAMTVNQFFENPDNVLRTKSKEELIEMIKELRGDE